MIINEKCGVFVRGGGVLVLPYTWGLHVPRRRDHVSRSNSLIRGINSSNISPRIWVYYRPPISHIYGCVSHYTSLMWTSLFNEKFTPCASCEILLKHLLRMRALKLPLLLFPNPLSKQRKETQTSAVQKSSFNHVSHFTSSEDESS